MAASFSRSRRRNSCARLRARRSNFLPTRLVAMQSTEMGVSVHDDLSCGRPCGVVALPCLRLVSRTVGLHRPTLARVILVASYWSRRAQAHSNERRRRRALIAFVETNRTALYRYSARSGLLEVSLRLGPVIHFDARPVLAIYDADRTEISRGFGYREEAATIAGMP
jgi:hypothetical protein